MTVRRSSFVLQGVVIAALAHGCASPESKPDRLGVTKAALVTYSNPGPADDADSPFNDDAIGETLTAPATAAKLATFSLSYTCPQAGGTMRGMVAEWTDDNHHVVGTPLFKSDAVALEAGTHAVTFNPGIAVTPGTKYIVFLALKEDSDFPPMDCSMPMNTTNPFPDGELWATFWADYILPNWGHFTDGQHDLVFNAVFEELPVATTTTLAASPTTALPGSTVSLTATVSAGAGDVEFFDGATSLGKVALSGTAAAFDVTNIALGDHSFLAKYAGDVEHDPSTSNVVAETVASPPPDGGSDSGAPALDAGAPTPSAPADGGCSLVATTARPNSAFSVFVVAMSLLGLRRRKKTSPSRPR